MSENTFTIYVHGSCTPNPGVGGWAARIFHNNQIYTLAGSFKKTTNNRAELHAILEALKKVRELAGDATPKVYLHTCSEYALSVLLSNLEQSWRKRHYKGVKNTDLWKQIFALRHTMILRAHNTRGKRRQKLHEDCVVIAQAAIDLPNPPVDYGYSFPKYTKPTATYKPINKIPPRPSDEEILAIPF